ncbi:MAG: glycosyltransferase family 4 protein [Clostridia bacterium]|nr:glycosyltransferase family 4 protein [Clostridia bacterium]
MKVLNVCLLSIFTDGFSYQDNLLSKYQRLNGNDVTVITSKYKYSPNGKLTKCQCDDYIDKLGIRILRLATGKNKDFNSKFKLFKNFYKSIEQINSDVIFCHNMQFFDLLKVIKYVKRHPSVKLYIDSHADHNNSAKGVLSKKILHGIIWKCLAHKALPYTEKFFGVTPARVDFLIDVYGLPKEKVELLPLGADDDLVANNRKPEIRDNLRKRLGISDNQILIVSGGKIDHNKPQTLKLMSAVNVIDDDAVHLIVFGSVEDNLKIGFNSELSNRVTYIGWKNIEEIYELFAAADIVAFPGLHSVLWEQAVGIGKPCIFKRIPGFDHIDLGGNCMFFESDSVDEYVRVIKQAIQNIAEMKKVAEERGIPTFSYRRIAEKSIGGLK